MCLTYAVSIQYGERIVCKRLNRVGQQSRAVAGRSAGVPLVVADDEAPARCQRGAEDQTPEAIAPMTSSTAGASGLPMFSENSLASPAVTTSSFIAAFENTTPFSQNDSRRTTNLSCLVALWASHAQLGKSSLAGAFAQNQPSDITR